MDIDDVEDKFRRNLVAASTVILLCAVLDLPINELAGRLIGEAGKAVASWKILCIALAVLSYLSLRYWHSDVRANSAKALCDEVRRLRARRVRSAIEKDLKLYTEVGIEPKRFKNASELVKAVEDECTKIAQARGVDTPLPRPHLDFVWGVMEDAAFQAVAAGKDDKAVEAAVSSAVNGSEDVADFTGKGSLALSWKQSTWQAMTQVRSAAGEPISYSIPTVPAVIMLGRAWIRATLNSRGGLEFAWVLALASCAASWVLWRLWGAVVTFLPRCS